MDATRPGGAVPDAEAANNYVLELCRSRGITHVVKSKTMVSEEIELNGELEEHGIAYEELHHPEAYTAQRVAQREHVSGHRVAKVVCVIMDGRPVELVLPASRRLNLDQVRDVLRAGVMRLATELAPGRS